MNRNRRLTKDADKGDNRHDTYLSAEIEFGQIYVETVLRNEVPDVKALEKWIQDRHEPDWTMKSPKRKKVKNKALSIVLEMMRQGSSRRVHVAEKWTWDDVGDLIDCIFEAREAPQFPSIADEWELNLGERV